MGDAVDDEIPHPDVLKNDYPSSVVTLFSTGVQLIQSYGWFILAGVLVLLYFRKKFESTLGQWQRSREEKSHKKYDTNVVQSRLEAMEKSRQRMQEQLDAQAALHLEKQKKKEEEKRKQKIEDWDRHLEGKGYRSKYKPNEEGETSMTDAQKSKPKPKKPLRDNDFNPLMGAGGGACYRPPRRGGAGGG